jgi:hypothetical protein
MREAQAAVAAVDDSLSRLDGSTSLGGNALLRMTMTLGVAKESEDAA